MDNERLLRMTGFIVKKFEGLHRVGKDGLIYPYLCPTGYPTQGWGIRVASLKVPPITREQADLQLDKVLPIYINGALRQCPNLASEHEGRLAAVASWTYNLGETALAGSTFRKKILAEDWESAAVECKKWRNGRINGVLTVLPGLVTRRALEAEFLLNPEVYENVGY